MELKSYLTIMTRRWKSILLVSIAVFCLAAVGSQFVSSKYQAVAILRIVTPLGGSSDNINYQTTFATRLVNTYAQIATSEQMRNQLKEKLDLQFLPEITLKIIPDSEILQIVVESENPALAAKTANALADMLLSYQDNAFSASDSKELNILAARMEELQGDLTQAQQQHDQLVEVYSQTAADIDILDRTIKLKEIAYQNLQGQYEQIVVEEAVSTNSITKATKDTLIKEIERIGAELDALNQQYKALLTKSNKYQQKITLARQTIQSLQSAYSNLRSQYDNVSLANSRQENAHNMEIISRAFEPVAPSGPGRSFILGLGVICGLIAGIFTAFVIDNLDTHIFSLEQIERITSTPILGSISKFQKQKSNNMDNDPAIQRDYWLLRAEMQTLIHDGSNKTIMVTSPNRKEGKSSTVFRLALGLAQNQMKVLVVDADFRRPEQHKLFGVTVEHGLRDFISGEVESLKEVILNDVRPGLDLLPNPIESDNPIELLQSARWKSLFQAIATYDVVIFDTPAFLAVPDSLDLAKTIDGVVIVVQWGHTTSGDIQSICKQLESTCSKIIGVIVNHSPTGRKADSYHSEAGQSYGQSKKAVADSL